MICSAILLILALVQYSTGTTLEHAFLDCICEFESGCHPGSPCLGEGANKACGFYKIKPAYFEECKGSNGVEGEWLQCANDKRCAEKCVKNYIEKHIAECVGNRTPTFRDFALTHKGGAGGCKNPKSVAKNYWEFLDVCLRRKGRNPTD